jgi:hypothetical protein
MQAEHLGVVAFRHLLEGGGGRVAVARELRRLRAEQQGERLVRRDAPGVGGELPGRARIAGADRDQPVRHRLVGAHAAAIAQEARDRVGRAHDGARDRPQQHGSDGDRRRRGHQHHDGGLDALALPGDDDVARPFGQPHGAEREHRDDDEIDEDADHCGMGLMGWLLRADGRNQLRLVDA